MVSIEAPVITARLRERFRLANLSFCILEAWVGGTITGIDDIKVLLERVDYTIQGQHIAIFLDFKLLVLVAVLGRPKLVSLEHSITRLIPLQSFDPPLTYSPVPAPDQAYVVVSNYDTDYHLAGPCTAPGNPHKMEPGTLLRLDIEATLGVRLGRQEDVEVVGFIEDD